MPDQFPTFEVVAALGLLVVLARAVLLHNAARNIAELNDDLLDALHQGDLAGARGLAARAESAAYAQIAAHILRSVERCRKQPGDARQCLEQAFDRAYRVAARRIQSGRARDLVALAVLLGAVVYAWRALSVGTAFNFLCGAGALLVVYNFIVRGRVLAECHRVGGQLVAAAAELEAAEPGAEGVGPCPECGTERLTASEGELELGAQPLAVGELSLCPSCGRFEGRVADPAALENSETDG